jgi:hypothetical protein
MRRALQTILGFAALVLSLGCCHVAGQNDCGCDIPICGHCRCNCASGWHGEWHSGTITYPEVVPQPKGSGAPSGSGSGSASGSGAGSGSGSVRGSASDFPKTLP